MHLAWYICSAQSENSCNLKIALRILRILRLHSNFKIAHYSCAISRWLNYSAQSPIIQEQGFGC